ncbi:MAG: hypothetical protein MJB57_03365 [Gemmatimonadetes bacterium]|nr:hypothetical protein [Gemmatimonadota bacterium]
MGLVSMFAELKKRHLLQIALIYLGAGWLFIEITDFLVGTYGFSRKILDTVVLLAILGFPAFLIIGWFHGERGHQRVQRSELWMLFTLGVMGAIGTYQIATGEPVDTTEDLAVLTPGAEAPQTDAVRTADLPAGPSLAVLPFKNNVADPDLGWLGSGLADLLTTNFAQLPGLQVVGRQRLYDILTEEGRTEDEAIPDQLASTVARAAGARTMLWGSVSGSAQDLVIDAQIIDVETGAVRAAERVRGQDVFAMVDSLTQQLVPQLTSNPGGQRPPRLALLGTTDMRALGAFHEGVALEREGRYEEAAQYFERAADHDSTFVLPLARLAGRAGRRDPEGQPPGEDEREEAVDIEQTVREVETLARSSRQADLYRRRAMRMLAQIGEDIEMGDVSSEEFLANLDSTLTHAMSRLDFAISVGRDSASRPPRGPRAPRPR